MKRIIYSEEREIDGKKILVQRIQRLEYSGEWADDGYDITVDGTTSNLIGWPTNNDLKRLVERHLE